MCKSCHEPPLVELAHASAAARGEFYMFNASSLALSHEPAAIISISTPIFTPPLPLLYTVIAWPCILNTQSRFRESKPTLLK